uniref:Uncharacterized protein n=1 Tax=Graphocephala atropunctata TaxID=36148 RepID=A0A1B6LBW5_9HEMI
MSDLEKHFSEYFIYFYEVMTYWSSLNNKVPEILRPISNQTEQLRLCSRAMLDTDFLMKFPDIKAKLIGKIHSNIEEEMVALDRLQEEVMTLADGLRSRLTSLEKAYSKYNRDADREFDPLTPVNENLLVYAEDIWRCFHTLWLGVQTAIETIDYFDDESIANISKAFLKYNQVETHLHGILDLTFNLRSS